MCMVYSSDVVREAVERHLEVVGELHPDEALEYITSLTRCARLAGGANCSAEIATLVSYHVCRAHVERAEKAMRRAQNLLRPAQQCTAERLN